jgi:hypothetical protein
MERRSSVFSIGSRQDVRSAGRVRLLVENDAVLVGDNHSVGVTVI